MASENCENENGLVVATITCEYCGKSQVVVTESPDCLSHTFREFGWRKVKDIRDGKHHNACNRCVRKVLFANKYQLN